MIIDYISTAMDKQDFADLFANSKNIPGQQGPKFNRLLIEGLAANGVTVHACTGRPVTRSSCNKLFLPAQKTAKSKNLIYYYSSVCNIPVIKNLWQMVTAYFAVIRDSRGRKNAVVCDVLNASIAYGASLAAKHRKIPCIGIVTDLPELMVTGTKKGHIRLVERNIQNCTAYVLLTEAMNEKVNPENKPYVIIEGICDTQMQKMEKNPSCSNVKKCIYAGLLDARYGVKMLVDGFLLADIPNTELHIYGNGPYEEELRQVVQQFSNVIFHGVVMNDEVVQAELDADLLINPRPTHEEFTKYSFPSKNMEYMVSGTAVLTTKLPGMPDEYCSYVYLAEKETTQSFCDTLHTVLSLSKEELNKKGQIARDFVLLKKNNVGQAEKILNILMLK